MVVHLHVCTCTYSFALPLFVSVSVVEDKIDPPRLEKYGSKHQRESKGGYPDTNLDGGREVTH